MWTGKTCLPGICMQKGARKGKTGGGGKKKLRVKMKNQKFVAASCSPLIVNCELRLLSCSKWLRESMSKHEL